MASLFPQFHDATSGTTKAVTRAKRLANIAVLQGTGSNDIASYQKAMNILQPYVDAGDLTAQTQYLEYQNKIQDAKDKSVSQDMTYSHLQQQMQDALYSKGDLARDPATLAALTSDKLDALLSYTNTAISTLDADGKSTDKLQSFKNQLSEMADAQRTLVNNMQKGTIDSSSLDGFGYYIKTNPVDGSFIGAAVLPVNSGVSGVDGTSSLTGKVQRISSTYKLGNTGAELPVYLPTTMDANGQNVARLGANTWSSDSSSGILDAVNTPDFKDGFTLGDTTKFPIKDYGLQAGQIVRAVSGVDDNKNTTYSYFYKGKDGSVSQLNEDQLTKLSQDPIVQKQIVSGIQSVSPNDVLGFGTVKPFAEADFNTLHHAALYQNGLQDSVQYQQANQEANGGAVGTVANAVGGVEDAIVGGVKSVGGAIASFFGNKNRTPAPQAPSASIGGQPSGNEVIDAGRRFFATPTP